MTLFDVLAATAAAIPSRPAVTDLGSGATLTYAELLASAEAVAARLRSAGVRAGERVALVAGNELAHVGTAFGIVATGAAVVPVAPSQRPAELAEVLHDIDVAAIVRLGTAIDTPVVERRETAGGGPRGETAPAFIRFSSGTTAASKGVILATEDVLARVSASDAVLRLGPEDRVLWTLPLAYHFAVTITAYVRAGAHVLLASDTLPAALVDAAARHAATVLYGSPVQFERMALAGRRTPLRSVRVALSTAAPLREEVATRFGEAFGVPLGQAYGIIEAGLPCINTRAGGAPATSVGPPVPGYEIRIVDDAGRGVPGGGTGEVWIRGEGLFSGYWSPRRTRAEVLRDGWFATGDVGALDDAGRLTLVGRLKSTIIVAGMKVFAEEIEACLDRQPGVAASRAFGRAHPRLGEVPCAEVVAAPGGPPPEPGALARACAQALSSHKVPVEIRIVDALPRTPGGKLLRRG